MSQSPEGNKRQGVGQGKNQRQGVGQEKNFIKFMRTEKGSLMKV